MWEPRNSGDLLRRGQRTSKTIKDCFCPLAAVLRRPLLQKKGGTNLNVKVSVINHPGGKGGTVPVQAVHGCVGSKESAPHIGGRHLAK